MKLPKKGDLTDPNNWRGVTLLSVPGKVFVLILLNRLKSAVDAKMREEQAGFRPGRSCTDQIFALRRIVEKTIEYQQEVNFNFIDFEKAFDSVDRSCLWKIAASYGTPSCYIDILKSLYERSCCCVNTEDGFTDDLEVKTGVRQGFMISPLLFGLAVDWMMRKADDPNGQGIYWNRRQKLRDLDFADDIALISQSRHGLQVATDKVEEIGNSIGLKVSYKKSKVMSVGGQRPFIPVNLRGQHLEDVNNFIYLGSSINGACNVDVELNRRTALASSAFSQLSKVWRNRNIRLPVKMRIYNACVLPVFSYGSETWQLTEKQEKKLDVFDQRCLRRILRVRWQQRVSNAEIRRRSQQEALSVKTRKARLRWFGHVSRMEGGRITKQAMEWRPRSGQRRRGGQRMTWQRTVEGDLERMSTTWTEAGRLAKDRRGWKELCARLSES